jgi:outer membrane receptor protein involved in Fe transport
MLGIGGVALSPGGNPTGGAAVSVDGASGAENVFYVDGIDTTSMYTGSPNQGVRTDLVQELQIKTAGYEAQFGGAMGGVVSVVTRRGGNLFSGSAFYHYDGSALSGKPRPRLRLDPYSAVDVAEYVQDPEDSHRRHELGFTLGGPIVGDRAWFFGAVIPQYSQRSRDVEFVRGDEGSYTRNERYLNLFGKVDVQPHPNLRLTGLYTSDTQREEGGLPGRDGSGNPDFNWEEQGFNHPSRTYMATASFILSTDFLLDARFGFNHIGEDQLLEPPGVRHQFVWSNEVIGFSSDHPLYRPRFWAEFPGVFGIFLERDDQDKSTISVGASYYFAGAGQHTLKAGYQFNRLSHDINEGYRFDIISYRFGQVYNMLDGTPAISSCTGPDGVVYTPCGYYYAFHPYGFVANIHTDRHAFYIQDGWILGDRFSLNAGLRFEKEAIPSFDDLTGASIPVFQWGFGDKVAPRLGGSWDVFGDGKLKAFGSWGRFYDAMKLTLGLNAFGGFKFARHAYLLDDTNLDWTQHGGLNGEGPFPGTFIESWEPGFALDALDPELRPMRMSEVVAGLEWELRADTALSFRFVHKNLDEAIEDVGRLTPTGESFYITNPGRGFSVSKLVEAGLPPTPKPERTYNAAEVRLRRRFSNRWSADVSYVYSRLRGLYSGLASSDERGRMDPNYERDFDNWYLNYDSHGNVLDGPLATDRPHQLKAYAVYDCPFGLSLGGFFNAMSGTPITRIANLQRGAFVKVEGRGSDGRNPTWSMASLFLVQSFRPFEDPGKRIEVNFNVVNLFNQKTPIWTFDLLNLHSVPLWNPGDDPGIVLNGYDYQALMAAQGVEVDPRFLKTRVFMSPITARFGVKFIF